MVPDSKGLYVGLVGWCDIHCKFLSTFRGCVLPNESICMNCMLHMGSYYTYDVCKLCILYHFWMIFVLVFCPCLIYYSYIVYKFHPLWDQYTDSIVPLAYVPVWCCAYYFVKLDLIVNILSSLICTSSNQWIICHIWSVLYVVKCGECIVTYANHLTFGSI